MSCPGSGPAETEAEKTAGCDASISASISAGSGYSGEPAASQTGFAHPVVDELARSFTVANWGMTASDYRGPEMWGRHTTVMPAWLLRACGLRKAGKSDAHTFGGDREPFRWVLLVNDVEVVVGDQRAECHEGRHGQVDRSDDINCSGRRCCGSSRRDTAQSGAATRRCRRCIAPHNNGDARLGERRKELQSTVGCARRERG